LNEEFFSIFMAFAFSVVFLSRSVQTQGSNGAGIILGNERFMDFYLAYTWDDEWLIAGDYNLYLALMLNFREESADGIFFNDP
jgi:hypothetical protein